ncbi:MAG: GNAT family N-acetyltransferase [Bacteroidales bacterium]|nr:GNAT family N-acetyltransferase [Bacteroidales bacterium]
MIRFVKHKDILPEKWDTAVLESPFRTVFCTYRILNALTQGSTWNALVMDDYDYVMPLPERSKFYIRYIYTPFFLPQMGIFSAKAVTAAIVSDFFNAIPKTFKQIDALLNVSNDYSDIESHTISLVSHQLKLSAPYLELYAGFSQNTQRNIKSARKQNLTFQQDQVTIQTIIDLFRNNKGQENSVHFKDADYQLLDSTANILKEMGMLDVISVHNTEGQCLAGALMVKDFDRYWFWFSGRDNQFAAAKPMFFLLDEYIQKHAEESKWLDFNGSMNENVARLYKGLGGLPYPVKMINYTKKTYWNLLLKLYRKIKS